MIKNKKPFKIANIIKDSRGLTLVEILLAVFIGILIILSAYAGFIMGKKIYQKILARTNIIQNGRVALDRIARELRQTDEILEVLPESEEAAISSITFQDGHDTSTITYITYEKIENTLQKKVTYYYFEVDSNSWVRAGTLDNFGNSPQQGILNDFKVIAEGIFDLKFWKEGNVVHIKMRLEEKGESVILRSQINPRNL